MKKLNNRQNQVKSLDFTSNGNFLCSAFLAYTCIDNQALQRSPKLLQSFVQQQSHAGLSSKNPQKSEINHFMKKNTAVPSSTTLQGGKNGSLMIGGPHLAQVESSQSIRTSPIKSDTIGPKQYPQSIQKASTHKTQKIKIGMHKKAVSLMGGSTHTSQGEQQPQQNFYDFQKQATQIEQQLLKQQSYVPSSQTSFNDYSSAHNPNNYGDGKAFPTAKVDNFLMSNDKTSSLLTTQQQQQVKLFQKMLHESQMSQQTFDPVTSTQDMIGGVKSFDQRPPLNQQPISSHQSQRLSLASDTPNQLLGSNAGYRSHANSFKGSQHNIAMKHAPNKYIKGAGTTVVTAAGSADTTSANLNYSQGSTATAGQVKSKKTLQYHHQRTLSDNPTSQFTNSKAQLFNANATSQVTNRNFQELIRSVNNKEQLAGEFMNQIGVSNTQESYPQIMSNTISQGLYPAKTTIGSSRQSAQSQVAIDDKDIMLQQYQGRTVDKQPNEISNVYQASFKDQIMKTKQALKLQQNQFGGPSRKVVQNSKFIGGNPNTQSYRLQQTQQQQQSILNGTQLSKIAFNATHTDQIKQTPKLNYHKKGKSTIINNSIGLTQGARTTNNSTQISNIVYSEKIKKQKHLKTGAKPLDGVNTMTHLGNLSEVTINKHGATKNNFHKTGMSAISSHKRSASDGNAALFLSLSNRGQIQQNSHLGGQGLNGLAQSLNMGSQAEILKMQNNGSGMYSKQQSMHKMQQLQPQQNIAASSYNQKNIVSNEYQIISDRHSYNQSLIQPNNNVLIHSHRKIGESGKHMRHNSDQMTMDVDKYRKQDSLTISQKKNIPQPKSTITIQKSQREVGSAGNPVSTINNSEMIIMDQGINQISSTQVKPHNIQSLRGSDPSSPSKASSDIRLNSFYKQSNQPSQTLLKPVEERIETQESAVSDPNLTPRSRMNVKINKKIKMAFSKGQGSNTTVTTTTDFYKIGKVMGKGAFGKVNLAIHRLSNKFVALKSINKTFLSEEAAKKKVMQEFNILRRTRHINIVRLYESFETAQHIVFVIEVCGGGDLLTYVRRRRKLKEDVAKNMFKQIVEGLRYCHSKNILHRDIKLDNILLTSDGNIKICDFGVSKLVRPGEIMTEQCGTPAYIAPEVFENKGYEGYASDVWSAGVVLYAMLYGTVPFKANNMTELQKQITKCQTSFKDEISPESISLLKGILERDPTKRLKISEILKHPWMQDIPEQVSVFTDQEKEKTNQEFAYYNFKKEEANDNGEIVHTDPFTEQMLNSTQNSLVKNASTKSVILAPFNSTRSHIDDDYHLRKSIQELIIDKKNFKFAAKVKEIDRQYEANNNAELDNGVYHQDSEEDKKPEEAKAQVPSSAHSSQDGDEYGQKKQSEWQKLEQMVIDRQKTEEEEEDFNLKQKLQNLGSAMTLVIDDKLVGEIEKSGFPKQYIVNSLNNDDMNYVTTYYYLLTTQKEY